ncbi:serine hydrolase domain-containing protein [Streptomyces ficellus]|uniref:Class A beta-lactamase-related serine hydrolase n=1 Tax=Streptomyces ficellus TaxID=1977088 RepID=A0A6I6FI03_9ACTN|nr:serine hydrolase domain-containing protein [Streptomyces ficellus]QGV78229.1 class A beta-lactamase-related serine hydrolase [Streptomyces ficellus]
MNTRTRALLAAALVLGVAAGPLAAPAGAREPAAASRAHIGPDAAALAGLPDDDATAALVRVGGTGGSWRGSAGVHDLRSGRPADPAGRFRAGSVTKVFTAAVVLQLAGEGKVDLDGYVRDYLPDLIPAAYGKVKVRQLLDHTHGMPGADVPGKDVHDWYAHRFDVRDPRATVASATAKERVAPPGEVQRYGNIGYTVAGLLIERVSGDRYENQVARRILRPLGLRGTYFPGASPRIRGPHNHGYQVFPLADGASELRDVTVWGVTEAWAAGDLVSTTADLERFLLALFRGEVVRGPLLKEMFTVPAGVPGATMSAGLQRYEAEDGRVLWLKTGGRWGYNTMIAATGDLSRTLVYSVNSTDAKGLEGNPVAERITRAAFAR